MQYVSHPLIYPNGIEKREYQIKIAEAARNKNTLIILPTALGKTVISALVAVDIVFNYKEKRILVLAPTRPLCMQHKERFQKIIRFPTDDFILLTGKISPDFRKTVWDGSQKFVFATPQVVRNDILMERFKLDNFGLIIFDECHRSVKEYAYTEVSQQYMTHSQYPLILGMTASPGSDFDRVKSVCGSLFIEHVEYRKDDDPDVKPYIQPVQVEWRIINLPIQYQPLRDILRGMLYSRINWLKKNGYLKNPYKDVTRKQIIELGLDLRYNIEISIDEERGSLYLPIMQQSAALTLFHMLEILQTQGAFNLKSFMERMENDDKKSHKMLVRSEAYRELQQLLDGNCYVEHPKAEALVEIIKNQIKLNPNSRMLVFTQYRDSATHIVDMLNQVDTIKVERFVGQMSKMGDRGLTQDEQAALINDLKNGFLNTLVATSIAEEGLDIPEVDLVLFYEPIPSEIRYIQRKGRTGRAMAGKVIILATNDTQDMIYMYSSSRRAGKMDAISSKLNDILKPVLRLGMQPPKNPMSNADLTQLQKNGKREQEQLSVDEVEKFKILSRDIARAEKAIYFKILEGGLNGLNDENIYQEMQLEGFSKNIIKMALAKLVKKKHIAQKSHISSIPLKQIPGSKILNIEIEKILSGQALVIIDGKWRARLLNENYEGPKNLIKRGSRFMALCEVYHDSGVPFVKVRQVTTTRT